MVIIGAGPAGLTAAYELARRGTQGIIVEADETVGGIARTVERDGYRFDLGGHRFFTKVKQIEDLWQEMLGEPLLRRPRLSRIHYRGNFYDYPLKASNALRNMGLATAAACLASYVAARLHPIPSPANLEQWVTNQFGAKLYRMFFKTYTEKVWGIPCTEIGADWAAQRIKGLNLGEAVRNAVFGQRRGSVVKTLLDEFLYPRLGPGQLWEACAAQVTQRGWQLLLGTRVTGLRLEGNRVAGVTVTTSAGDEHELPCTHVLSSMPLRELLAGVRPAPPEPVSSAADRLRYRDFLTVALVLDTPTSFPDSWIYVHSPEVRLGRIQNYRNWSAELVPDPAKTCLGLEYFVNEGDGLWRASDDELVALGYRELSQINLASGALAGGYVARVRKAYPVYDRGYAERVAAVRQWAAEIGGLACIGRNGQHRYNNMDHSMMTALIAAGNVAGDPPRDPWAVNEDAEYQEEGQAR